MNGAPDPAFGQADLTNCEREQIHLAGSIQPHGLLLAWREADGRLLQVSANAAPAFGLALPQLLAQGLAALGPEVPAQVQAVLQAAAPDGADALDEPRPFTLTTTAGAAAPRAWHAHLHRVAAQGLLVLELETPEPAGAVLVQAHPTMLAALGEAVQRFGQAASIGALSDAVVRCVRDLTGYDRVMVYKFDPDGHGKIIAEARDPRLESLLGHHYPATDIPQRARQLYLRNRVRVLVDVHYAPVPLAPARLAEGPSDGGSDGPAGDGELDMSMCTLRSMSPLHLQYLKNMGVTATLVVSLVREGRLWGLIAAHHYSARALAPALRDAIDLVSEAAATRIAAIENYAHAQVAILVRRLEQRLVDATSIEGDWRLALFRNPRTLLQPLEATGAALQHDGELLTSGEVPSTPELRALLQWIDAQYTEAPFACSSVGQANPALDSLTPVASGVLAVKLSASRPDYLLWFRKEQLLTVTWAGDPSKPMVGDDPSELSPRRSFAAWSEIVRGTALPWSRAEQVLARAVGEALVDMIVQVNAVRLLVAEHQLAGIRSTVRSSQEAVAIADVQGRLLFVNPPMVALLGAGAGQMQTLQDLATAFESPQAVRAGLVACTGSQHTWRSDQVLRRPGGAPGLPVALRVDVVPDREGGSLGHILTLADRSNAQKAHAARAHLEQALQQASPGRPVDEVIGAILTNASLAAMDIADSAGGPGTAPLLQEVEASAQRATALYARIRAMVPPGGPGAG